MHDRTILLPSTYYPRMDYMRYFLAVGVLLAHFNILLGKSIPYLLSSYDCVGAFFSISGFLVYPSFEKRPRLKKYIFSRGRRILPPYIFIVLVCAFGLVTVSENTAIDYFRSMQFWKYLVSNLCFLNWLEPSLPGVFQGQAFIESSVNGSLWTMKVEWALYLSVPIVVWLIRKMRRHKTIFVVSLIVFSIVYRCIFYYLYSLTANAFYEILSRQFFGQVSYFYMGVLVYFHKKRFRSSLFPIIAIGIAGMLLRGMIPYGHIVITPIAVSMIILAISLSREESGIRKHRYDISYEIYLFHFPLLQLMVWAGVEEYPVWLSFPIALLAVFLFTLIYRLWRHLCLPSRPPVL